MLKRKKPAQIPSNNTCEQTSDSGEEEFSPQLAFESISSISRPRIGVLHNEDPLENKGTLRQSELHAASRWRQTTLTREPPSGDVITHAFLEEAKDLDSFGVLVTEGDNKGWPWKRFRKEDVIRIAADGDPFRRTIRVGLESPKNQQQKVQSLLAGCGFSLHLWETMDTLAYVEISGNRVIAILAAKKLPRKQKLYPVLETDIKNSKGYGESSSALSVREHQPGVSSPPDTYKAASLRARRHDDISETSSLATTKQLTLFDMQCQLQSPRAATSPTEPSLSTAGVSRNMCYSNTFTPPLQATSSIAAHGKSPSDQRQQTLSSLTRNVFSAPPLTPPSFKSRCRYSSGHFSCLLPSDHHEPNIASPNERCGATHHFEICSCPEQSRNMPTDVPVPETAAKKSNQKAKCRGLIGVRALWVAREHKGKGIAVHLLEEARRDIGWSLGFGVAKHEIAWSKQLGPETLNFASDYCRDSSKLLAFDE